MKGRASKFLALAMLLALLLVAMILISRRTPSDSSPLEVHSAPLAEETLTPAPAPRRIERAHRWPPRVRGVDGMSHPRALRADGKSSAQFDVIRRGRDEVRMGSYELSFDFMLSDFGLRDPDRFPRSVDALSILFDLPKSMRLDLTVGPSGGRLSYRGRHGGPRYVGEFTLDTVHTLKIRLDLDLRRWTAWLNSRMLFQDVVSQPHKVAGLRSVRIHLENDQALASDPVAYLEDIRLYEVAPSPR